MNISHVITHVSTDTYELYAKDRTTCCIDLCKNLRKNNKYFCRRHKCRVKNCNLQGIGVYHKCFGHLLFLEEV
jgi:hypothetical protein